MSDTVQALRACYSALQAAHETMLQILRGEVSLRTEEWEVIEPVHKEALAAAEAALDEVDHTKYDAEEPLRIKRWIRDGELSGDEITNTNELYEAVGGRLDSAYANDITGTVVFEGENGKFYVMSVEGCLAEASPEYVTELLAENAEGTEDAEEDP